MAGVFREITINYKDKDYSFVPSNKLLRRIEQEVTLVSLTDSIHSAKPRISDIAYVATEFLKEGGCDGINEDEMFSSIMFALANNENLYGDIVKAITMAITPTEDVAKNSPAPQERKGANKKTA